ncbi:hypothetical protein TRFO_03452 [Tritrichomonas foetus]|uniref:Beige/BEACH domain containing protein n=1 Tax=Tritrichomonas foetus TaxID=1144522 RepID=A0A1J4KTQ0_9EUKA|nr:hypothetical protein TRFO_03452 [Tritrichomonas foetus]|eukprot:OHT13038.1 hypothetical protein TRFO_03452 [Tritrichomonas foetus]
MNASRKLISRYINFIQSVYKISLKQPDVPIPFELLSLIPPENEQSILSSKQNATSIVNDAGLYYDVRFTLISTVLGYFNSKKLTQLQRQYISIIVLRSCCGILFWELNQIDPHCLLVFMRALNMSIPFLQSSPKIIENFFALFVEKIYKLGDIDSIIPYFPSINELMTKYPHISTNCYQLHLETSLKLCKKLQSEISPFYQATISMFFRNFSRSIHFCPNHNLDSVKIVHELLEISKVPTPTDLLVSYLSLLLAFHYHNIEIIPLLEKISNGLINADATSIDIYDAPTEAIPIMPLSGIAKSVTFPHNLSFERAEKPSIPNLNELPPEISKPSVMAATEIADHFIFCGLKEFLAFSQILLKSQNYNIQATLIISIMITGPLRTGIAESFAKVDAWKILFNERTFDPSITFFDDPFSRLVNLRQSIFDVLAFLCTNETVMRSIRQSFRIFLARIVQHTKFASEIILMSYPQLHSIYTLPNSNDHLIDILLEIAILQQQDHVRDKSVAVYRFPTLFVILTILNHEECLKLAASSQYACEALLSMMFETSLHSEIKKIVIKLNILASTESGVDHVPFTNALHQLFLIIIDRPDTNELLLEILKMIEEHPSPILLKSKIINDIFNTLFSVYNPKIEKKEEIVEYSLRILLKVKNYQNFDPSIVPYKKIANACKFIGISQTIFDILYNICITKEIITYPQALPMLLIAIQETEYLNFVIDKLIDLCKDSICNRCSCLIGQVPSIIFRKKNPKRYDLFSLISMTISNPESLKAFFRCFECDDDIEECLKYLRIIIEQGSDVALRPRIQFSSPGSHITVDSIPASMIENGFLVLSHIFIESNEPHRNFFVLKGGPNTFTVSFLSHSLLYMIDTEEDTFQKLIDADYPIKRWFELSIMLKPSEGFTVSFDSSVKAGLSLPQIDLGNYDYTFQFFTSFHDHFHNSKSTNDTFDPEPIQMYSISLSANFAPDELSVEDSLPPSVFQSHRVYQFSSEFMVNKKLISNNMLATFNGIPIKYCCKFLRSFEVTHSINILLSLFRKIDRKYQLLPSLLHLIFNILPKSDTTSIQILEKNGFAIIGYFLEKARPSDLSIDLWHFMVDQIPKMRSEELRKSFAQNIFYNFDIWSHASIDVQVQVVTDWQRIGIFSEIFMTIPFLLHMFHWFTNPTDSLPQAMNENYQIQRKMFVIDLDAPKIFDQKIGFHKNGLNGSLNNDFCEGITKNKSQYFNWSPSSNIPSPSIINTEEMSYDSFEDEIPPPIHRTPTRSTRRIPRITASLSNSRIPQVHSNGIFRTSSSISSLSYQKTLEFKAQSIRKLFISLIKSVISIQKINQKDAQFLFQAIQKATEPEHALELLNVVSYIIDLGLQTEFDMKGEWFYIFLHQSEDVRIKWMGLFAKMFPDPSPEQTEMILMLLIIQSQRILNNSFVPDNSLLVETIRICLNVPNSLNLNNILEAPLFPTRLQYLHFAIAISIAAPHELNEVFAKILSSIVDIEENVIAIAESATSLFLFLLIYWSLRRSRHDKEEEEKQTPDQRENMINTNHYFQSLIQSHRRFSLPLKIDNADKISVKILSSICSVSPSLLRTAIGILDSISTITTADLSEFRSLFLNFVFALIAKRPVTQVTVEFTELLAESLFFHYKTYESPSLTPLFEAFDSVDRQKKKFDAQVPDLITLVNVYSGDTTKLPVSYFSLCLDSNGSWADKSLAQSLIFFGSALKEEKLRPLLSMLCYFYCQSQSQAECAPLSPLICDLLKKKDNFSFLIAKSLSHHSSSQIMTTNRSRNRRRLVFDRSVMGSNTSKRENSQIMTNDRNSPVSPKYPTPPTPPRRHRRRHSDVSSDVSNDFCYDFTNVDTEETELTSSIVTPTINNSSGINLKVPPCAPRVDFVPANHTSSVPKLSEDSNSSFSSFQGSSFYDELPQAIHAYVIQANKMNEIYFTTLTQFSENAPTILPDTHKNLVDVFSGLVSQVPKNLKNYSINLATKIHGKRDWQQLSHQIYTRNQSHFKRSSFVDSSLRPVILKRNCGFDSSHLKSQQNDSDPNVENRIDSIETLFEAQCERIKVSKSINGTFYVISNSKTNNNDSSKILRFIPSNGKLLEIDTNCIIHILPMFILQRQTAIEVVTKQRHSILFNFHKNSQIKLLMALLPVQFPTREFLNDLTDQWCRRNISNFEYLTWLNYLSGRTFHSAYAYPVFPWIIQDYSSEVLNIDDSKIYRDLSKPVGALNPSRLNKLKILRMDTLEEDNFLYRSTYSCAFHVFHYLVRLEPFTSLHISMQDGKFDVAHRLFSSISNSYDRVVGTSFNFRELIPEFFFCSDFLKNVDKFAFGGGIDNVELPVWSTSAIDFIYKNRCALESEYASLHLNEWIDLIWGFKQTGQAAEDSDNVFDPHLYPNVWQNYKAGKEQIEELLSHVGQIPQQLFENPHPKRSPSSSPTYNYSYSTLLISANNPICCSSDKQITIHRDGRVFNLKNNLSKEQINYLSDFICLSQTSFAAVVKSSNEILTFESDKIQKVPNSFHVNEIKAICCVGNVIFSGDSDGIISNENLSMNAHKKPISTICGSEVFRIIVSVSRNNLAVVCTADELRFIRSFNIDKSFGKINKCLICEGFGIIIFVATNNNQNKSKLFGYSLNGELIKSEVLNFAITSIVAATNISSEHDYLIIADDKKKVYLYNAFDFMQIKMIIETESPISSINYYKLPNQQLLIGTESGTLRYGSINI